MHTLLEYVFHTNECILILRGSGFTSGKNVTTVVATTTTLQSAIESNHRLVSSQSQQCGNAGVMLASFSTQPVSCSHWYHIVLRKKCRVVVPQIVFVNKFWAHFVLSPLLH